MRLLPRKDCPRDAHDWRYERSAPISVFGDYDFYNDGTKPPLIGGLFRCARRRCGATRVVHHDPDVDLIFDREGVMP